MVIASSIAIFPFMMMILVLKRRMLCHRRSYVAIYANETRRKERVWGIHVVWESEPAHVERGSLPINPQNFRQGREHESASRHPAKRN
jgi:hypothetical protein